MTTEARECVDLPPCKRRFGILNGLVVCKPPSFVANMPPEEFLKNAQYHRPRHVSCNTCKVCQEIEVPSVVDNVFRSTVTVITDKIPPKINLPTIHSDGTIEYEKTSFEPPPLPAGYERVSNDPHDDGAWVFKPAKAPCKYIQMLPSDQVSACGCVRVLAYCTRVSPPIRLNDLDCDKCEQREVKNERSDESTT